MKFLGYSSLVAATVLICCLVFQNRTERGSAGSTFHPTLSKREIDPALPRSVLYSEDPANKEVSTLVDRCFDGLVRYDDQTLKPSFIKGDFDGDGSMDLFATVQPGRKVDSNDKSKPRFNYYNVIDSVSPASAALDFKVGTLGIVEVWPLVVVVRNVDRPAANQCSVQSEKVLLQFPMDKGTSVMKLFKGKELPVGSINDPDEDQPPPKLKGDAVLLLDSAGDGMAIYWGRGRFRWYPVNDFH